jgi:hypothetical protein
MAERNGERQTSSLSLDGTERYNAMSEIWRP